LQRQFPKKNVIDQWSKRTWQTMQTWAHEKQQNKQMTPNVKGVMDQKH